MKQILILALMSIASCSFLNGQNNANSGYSNVNRTSKFQRDDAASFGKANKWIGAKFLNKRSDSYDTVPPFSFIYGGELSGKLIKKWKVQRSSNKLNGTKTKMTTTYSDPTTGLEVRCEGIAYSDFPVIEWVVFFKNTGKENTPVLENIQGIDVKFKRKKEGEFVLHGTIGDWCEAKSYQPFSETLPPNDIKNFASKGGRPTNSAFPYYSLQMPGGGMIFAFSWPGQWAASFMRDEGQGIRIVAGQELTHLILKPGEEIRTPLNVILFWKGNDPLIAQNLWRHWMITCNLPRTEDGKSAATQIVACSSAQLNECFNATEENQKEFINLYSQKGIKIDYWWCDLGWFNIEGDPASNPNGPVFDALYNPHPKRFPNGLKAVSDYAHRSGVKLITWFEPEHYYAGPGNWIYDHHPEWLLKLPAGHENEINQGAPIKNRMILNMGNKEAWQWVTNNTARVIREQGIDLFRLDFNIDPLLYWQSNDAPDRQGMTENLYVKGFLSFYDELRHQFPKLRIDNCASGGRRNDLETMRRAVPLLRSDYLFEPTGQQGHTFGLSSWLPYFGTGVHPTAFDAYRFRSSICPSMTLCYDVRKDSKDDFEQAAKLCTQTREILPFMLDDYYPLTPYTLADTSWIAWQYDRPETGEGVVQVFRHDKSSSNTMVLKLHGLNPKKNYEVWNIDTSIGQTLTGKELIDKGMSVEIKNLPGASVFTYRRKK